MAKDAWEGESRASCKGQIRDRTARSNKEKAKFAKSAEQNNSREVFHIVKVIHRSPRPVYELEDLNKRSIESQFYHAELSPVRITKRSSFQIDKILGQRVRRGIRYYLLRWKG